MNWPRVLGEAAAVAVLALAVSLAGNALSPRGLQLTRDYFPALPVTTSVTPLPATVPATPAASPAPPGEGTGATTAAAPVPTTGTLPAGVEERLRQRGLSAVSLAEAEVLFRDERHQQERVIFVDARKDEKFAAGHIPGAWPLDHYYPDRYLADLLPACQLAEVIVVYCTGGSCEDSEFAAVLLRDAGVPADRLKVFVGGIDAWTAAQLPVERGVRLSGELVTPGTTP